jgi:integrase
MKKEQVDLENRMVWLPDSKTPNGVAEVPLSEIAIKALESQIAIAGSSPYLFPSEENPNGYQMRLRLCGGQRSGGHMCGTSAFTI